MISTVFLLGLVFGFLPGILAQDPAPNSECRTPDFDSLNTQVVSQPSDLDIYADCTTIIGNIRINSTFGGSFIIPGVTNFTGSILMNREDDTDAVELEAIEMPDLLYLRDISLDTYSGRTRLVLPLVQRIDNLKVLQFADGGQGSIELPALQSVDSLSLAGFWTNVSLPSLETATGGLTIYTDPTYYIEDRPDLDPIDIDLPVLREVHSIRIKGHVRSLNTPNLAIIGHPNGPFPTGMEVQANYTTLPGVNLPQLKELHGHMVLEGDIGVIDLGGLQSTGAPIRVQAESPVAISSSLQSAGDIDLSGEISAVNFANITDATALSIQTNLILPCSTNLIQLYRELNAPREPPFCSVDSIRAAGENPWANVTPTSSLFASSTPTPTPSWSPTPTPTPGPNPGLDGGETAGVVVGAFGAVLLGAVGWWAYRGSKKKEGAAAVGAATGQTSGNETGAQRHAPVVGGADGDDEAPPPYSRDPVPEK
ncbi:hypothetical protein BJX99DRAFT_253210 [Aspergillus californicus]